MATWAEFAASPAEVLEADAAGGAPRWLPLEGGAAVLAAAGERLLTGEPGIALLATVARDGRPRVHPFMPRVLEGTLVAFVLRESPKLRDLLEGRACTIHSQLADEDEEFWVSGHARAVEDASRVAAALPSMPWAKPEHELLVEFDLDRAGWTTWLDFMTVDHRPRHHRWRASR